jgi:hypothetical protein
VAAGVPDITGPGPHIHRGLVEVFRVVDGAMTVRVGDDTWDVSGQDDAEIEVPAGILHGSSTSARGRWSSKWTSCSRHRDLGPRPT